MHPTPADLVTTTPPDAIEALRLARRRTRARWTVVGLAAWMFLFSGAVLALNWKHAAPRAVLLMAWGLIATWVVGGGLLMRWGRERWCRFIARIRLPWPITFVASCVALALTEEAITTTMTNLAPWFGVPVGRAYITASANYLDVVLYHSVVVFVPMFIAWALLLRWWRFTPFAVFLLFGLTGTLAETLTFGPQNLASFAFWTFVYGLMIWLPACAVPEARPARHPSWWAYPIAVFLPFLFVPLMAITAPWIWLTPKHPPIHFPPIGSAAG